MRHRRGFNLKASIQLDKLKRKVEITQVGAGSGIFLQYPRAGCARMHRQIGGSMSELKSDPDKVWPTGFTEAESQEIHRNVIQGTQIFGFIAVLAHLFAYIYSPWLK
jgi:light-harvesting protein B-800-850 beta chain